MKKPPTIIPLIIFTTVLYCIFPTCLFAEAPSDTDQAKKELASTENDESSRGTEVLGGHFELAAGAGGLFSEGSQSTTMLLHAGAGYRIDESWLVHFIWDSKFHPWENFTSLFQTIGLTARWLIWRGLFIEVGAGAANAFLQSGDYQQSDWGGGWLAAVGYTHYFNSIIGISGQFRVNQRWIRTLYTDLGVLVGPVFTF